MSGSHQLDQYLMFRPAPGWSRYTTPIERLYMIGASTWPGGGVHARLADVEAETTSRVRNAITANKPDKPSPEDAAA